MLIVLKQDEGRQGVILHNIKFTRTLKHDPAIYSYALKSLFI